MKFLRRFADPHNAESLGVRLRRRRFEFFKSLIDRIPRPLRILDVGGTERFWETMGFIDDPDVSIHIINLKPTPTSRKGVTSSVADATDMHEFADSSFDIVFSNSVIEHVGDFAVQRRMANEMRRVGQRYFMQTPNRMFPIEPHFLFPFFQFLPRHVQVFLVRNFSLGWTGPVKDREAAERRAAAITLLTRRQVKELFPDSELYEEKVLGLTKSFIAYGGWGHSSSGGPGRSLPR